MSVYLQDSVVLLDSGLVATDEMCCCGTGACCGIDETSPCACSDGWLESECVSRGGTFQGVGTLCADDPCPCECIHISQIDVSARVTGSIPSCATYDIPYTHSYFDGVDFDGNRPMCTANSINLNPSTTDDSGLHCEGIHVFGLLASWAFVIEATTGSAPTIHMSPSLDFSCIVPNCTIDDSCSASITYCGELAPVGGSRTYHLECTGDSNGSDFTLDITIHSDSTCTCANAFTPYPC